MEKIYQMKIRLVKVSSLNYNWQEKCKVRHQIKIYIFLTLTCFCRLFSLSLHAVWGQVYGYSCPLPQSRAGFTSPPSYFHSVLIFISKLLNQARYSFFCILCLLHISSDCNIQNVTFLAS